MWIRCCFCNWRAFSPNRDEDCRIVRLIAERTGFAVLDPEIRPIILDPQCERRVLDRHVASKTFCNIELRFLIAHGNYDLAFVSILWCAYSDFIADASSLANVADLFVRLFGKRVDALL